MEHSPVDFARILKQTQRYAMYWCIAPSLIEESSGSVEMIEVILVSLTSPETHICDLEVGPEMACRIPISFIVVIGPSRAVRNPPLRIVLVQIFGVLSHKLDCLRPQAGNRVWRIVEVDSEAIRFVMIRHISEHIVIDVAEEMDLWFNTPVKLCVCESRMLVEQTAVPTAHLVVGFQAAILDIILLQDLGRFLE
jgi:hypothetical protein